MKNVYESIKKYLFLGFAFFLPLHEQISTILILILVLITILGLKIKDTRKPNLILWAFPMLFILYAVSVFFFSNTLEIKFLESKLSLIAFPFVFVFAKDVPKVEVYKYFTYGCFIAYAICMSNSVLSAFFVENGHLFFNPLKNPERGFFEAIVYEGNVFFGRYFSILFHHTYFALYLSFALLLLNLNTKAFPRWILWLGNIIFPLGVVQTMSMAGFGSLFIVVVILGFLKINGKKKKIVTLLTLALIFILGMTIHPRIKLVIGDLTKKDLVLNPQSMDGIMLRLLSWDASIDIIKKHPIIGVGIGDAQKTLNKIYQDKGYIHPNNRKLNAHNQYLQLFIECGILGPLLLLAILILLWRQSMLFRDNNRGVIVALTLLMAYNFMFESVLSRYLGVSFFIFFSCLSTYGSLNKVRFD